LNHSTTYRILIVDDDIKLQTLLQRYLNEQGFEAKVCSNTEQMDTLLTRAFFDLIVLDLMLPGEHGLTACARLRAQGNNTPILMLTAKGDEADRILGLEMGCDDYLAKPFNPRELVARIASILRRHYTYPSGSPDIQRTAYTAGSFTLNTSTRVLTKKGQEIPLTTGQFALLVILFNSLGQSISRSELVGRLKRRDREADERSIDITISRLRKLIEDNPKKPEYLQTVWGYGYVFIPDDAAQDNNKANK